jgi:hypothetical protein
LTARGRLRTNELRKGYTRKNGLYTARLPWGEVCTAKRKDQLDHLMMVAERREKQRQELVRRMNRRFV